MGQNVASHLGRLARQQPERAALIEPGGRSVSFSEMESRTAEIAGGLASLGLEPGDRVLLLAPMGIPLYEALIASLRGLYTLVLLDPSAPTVAENLARVGLSAFIGSAKAHLLRLKHGELRGLKRYVSTGFTLLPHRRLDGLVGEALGPLDPPSDDFPALLTFTTGSTGRPKTVARSHRFLEAQRSILSEHMGLSEDDIDLPTLPVFLLNSLAAGATCVLPDADLRRVDSVDPARVIRQLQEHGCTSTSGSPAFYAPLAEALLADGTTLPSLKKLFTGGARVPAALLEKLVRIAPNARVEVVYGSTEAEPIASISADEVLGETAAAERLGKGSCVGRPVPQIDLRVAVPGHVEALQTGTIGEVVVAGEHVNEGYFEDPEANAENKVASEGRTWHRTGDTGYLDERGRIWLVGRVNDMVGELHPFMLEGRADAREWVRRSGLVAIDGEPVLAVAVEDPPEGWSEELGEELGVRVEEVDTVPVDPRHNAKIDRRALCSKLGRAIVER